MGQVSIWHCYLAFMPIYLLLFSWVTFVDEPKLAPEWRPVAWCVVVLATLLWPLVIPLYVLRTADRVVRYLGGE